MSDSKLPVFNARPRLAGLSLLALLFATSHAMAHDFWVEPSDFRPAAGDKVSVWLRVGEDFTGTSQPLIPNWFTDYSVTGPAGQQPVQGMIGDDPAGHFIATGKGSELIGYRSTRSFVQIDPPTFNNYLNKEGLDWVQTVREERGEGEQDAREYYSRCAKALVRDRAAANGEGFDTELGYTLELIPLRDPYALAPGAALPVELRYLGRPIGDLLVVAFTAENPQAKQKIRTDGNGRAVLQLDTPGTWLIKSVHIIEVENDPDAEWESFWASLTFQLDAAT